ncbi:MAG: single-stranded-DNA-specific exonuclease RecJ [Bacillales bacterium]|nr:single-stranded-DNA-specific exonuclease RecJ [Bacillales bacterium]
MIKSRTRWKRKDFNDDLYLEIKKSIKINDLLAKVLATRDFNNIDDIQRFIYDKSDSYHDPYLFKQMDKAVCRIKDGITKGEKIRIYGDYDADGVTSTTILIQAMLELGADVDFYIPNRFTEGYGPNKEAFRKAHEDGIKLIVTVDNGVSGIEEIDFANSLGIDVIITDHHEFKNIVPNAYAIIHPNLNGETYPFKELAGAGVALKLAHALCGYLNNEWIVLSAIGTIADLVPLKGENRIIATNGIKLLKRTSNLGLRAILKKANIQLENVSEDSIGFGISPRINAVGRLGDAKPAVKLLLEQEECIIDELVTFIEIKNRERQKLVLSIFEEAVIEAEKQIESCNSKVLVIAKENWNVGVIGIVASKLVDKFYRPTIVLGISEDGSIAKGSGRSITGFDLFKNLTECEDILSHFGGHPMAAGMTLSSCDVEEFRLRLNKIAEDQLIEEDFKPITLIDVELKLSEITTDSISELSLLAPFGMTNSKPRFLIKNLNISSVKAIGADGSHLKLTVNDGVNTLDCIGFGFGRLAESISLNSSISLAGELGINEWNNSIKPQIFICDISINEWQLFDFRNNSHWKNKIPRNTDTLFIVESENRKSLLSKDFNDVNISTIDEIDSNSFQNLVIVDLPIKTDAVGEIFNKIVFENLYIVFENKEDAFFETLPTREHFKWYYSFLKQNNNFIVEKHGHALSNKMGWSTNTLKFMTRVFFELEFVTINDGNVLLVSAPPKKDLNESTTYKTRLEKNDLEQKLLYSSSQELKRWLLK